MRVRVCVRIPEGFSAPSHVASQGFHPAELILRSAEKEWRLGRIEAPEPDAPVWEGELEISAVLTAPPEAEPGECDLQLLLRLQLCGEGVCHAPSEILLPLRVEVTG